MTMGRTLHGKSPAAHLLLSCALLFLTGCGHQAPTVSATTYQTGNARSAVAGRIPAHSLRITRTFQASLRARPGVASRVTLSDIFFLSSTDGWAAGSRCGGTPRICRGLVLKTTDGGQTWSSESAPGPAVGQIRFLNPDFGWVIGQGVLYTTSDGGATWQQIGLPFASTPFGMSLSVSFATPRSGWLWVNGGSCFTDGQCPVALYDTQNGGASWNLLVNADSPPGPSPSAALNPGSYVAGGDLGGGAGWLLSEAPLGGILTTRDNGAQWQDSLTLTGGAGGPVAADFAPGGVGWATEQVSCYPNSCPTPVFRSGDQGITWHRVASLPNPMVGLVASRSGQSAWFLTHTSGGSAAWNQADAVRIVHANGTLSPIADTGGWNLTRVSALNSRQAWAIGVGRGAGTGILHTTDGGHTWQVQYTAATSAVPVSASGPPVAWGFWNPQDGWAVGAGGAPNSLLLTQNGGTNWRRLPIPISQLGVTAGGTVAAGFPDRLHGWVLSANNRLLVTADGGSSWKAVPFAQPTFFGAVQEMGFTSVDQGWALGNIGKQRIQAASACKRRWAQGIAAGGKASTGLPPGCTAAFEPLLYRTQDGGRTWSPGYVPQGVVLQAAWLVSRQDGWAIGRLQDATESAGSDWLLQTQSGGKSWKPVVSLSSLSSSSVFGVPVDAVNRREVWLAIGSNLFGTEDGGSTWTEVHLPATVAAGEVPVRFVSPRIGWLESSSGLFQTTDGGRNWTERMTF